MQAPTHTKTSPPNRTLQIAANTLLGASLLFAMAVVILPIIAPGGHDPRPVQDLSNIRQILICLISYELDEGKLPAHVHEVHEYTAVNNPAELFVSVYDSNDQALNPSADTTRWYTYGSFWFYPTAGLSFEDITEPSHFVLLYRTPRKESDYYIAGFADGHVESMDEESLLMHIQDQHLLIHRLNKPIE